MFDFVSTLMPIICAMFMQRGTAFEISLWLFPDLKQCCNRTETEDKFSTKDNAILCLIPGIAKYIERYLDKAKFSQEVRCHRG